MAETRKAKPKKSKPKARAKPSNGTKRSNGAAAAAKRRRKAPTASSNGSSVDSVRKTVVDGAHGAADGIAHGAQKAKLPLLATGAALAGGAAVAIAAKSAGDKRKILGVSVPKRSKVHVPEVHLPKGKTVKGNVRKAAGAVGDAASQADELGQRISKVARSVRAVSATADDVAKKA